VIALRNEKPLHSVEIAWYFFCAMRLPTEKSLRIGLKNIVLTHNPGFFER
jgi:hypothetical protein